MTLGSIVDLQDGQMRTPSVARLNVSHGLACWEDVSSSGRLRCATLSLEGTSLAKGATATVHATQVYYVSVAAFGEDVAVVCFLDDVVNDYGRCRLLTICLLNARIAA